VLLSDHRLAILNEYQRSDQTATIRGDVDRSLRNVYMNAYKLLNSTPLTEKAEVFYKFSGLSVHTYRLTVKINHKVFLRVEFVASNQICIFHTKIN